MTIVANKHINVENVNPIEFFYNKRVRVIAPVLKELFRNDPTFAGLSDIFWEKQASMIAKEVLSDNIVSIPEEWVQLFRCHTKHEQEKTLKGAFITPQLLFSIPVYAYSLGYLYSEYVFEYDPTITSGKKPPIIAIEKPNGIEAYGTTNMTKGEIRSSIHQTKSCMARMMSKDEEWICLFSSKRGIFGKESGQMGKQPHVHFISDKFGITKDAFLCKFKSGEASSSIHILLKDYLDKKPSEL